MEPLTDNVNAAQAPPPATPIEVARPRLGYTAAKPGIADSRKSRMKLIVGGALVFIGLVGLFFAFHNSEIVRLRIHIYSMLDGHAIPLSLQCKALSAHIAQGLVSLGLLAVGMVFCYQGGWLHLSHKSLPKPHVFVGLLRRPLVLVGGFVILALLAVTAFVQNADQQKIKEVEEQRRKSIQELMLANEPQKQQPEQEKPTPEQGEPIEYSLFYAKAKSTGLPIGKRYRFTALVCHELHVYLPDYSEYPNLNDELWGEAAFDDEAQHQQFLLGKDWTNRTIVASMGSDGMVQIHRIE
ncbi:MAG: hypothetical protein P4N24_04360 [Acidobacteriota bacterium]|nr:hypothetical protein [Acidobacteriota bacterium]